MSENKLIMYMYILSVLFMNIAKMINLYEQETFMQKLKYGQTDFTVLAFKQKFPVFLFNCHWNMDFYY